MIWEEEFGDEYTKRNLEITPRDAFWAMLNNYNIETAYEIGCNWGANLEAIKRVTAVRAKGCDVNLSAVDIGIRKGLDIEYADGTTLRYGAKEFDLVFTVGVLIHQTTGNLIRLLKEMHRLSKRYVLFGEYYSDIETEVPYRGERGLLFKRDFGDVNKALFPEDWLVDIKVVGKDMGFDGVTVWIYDIGGGSSADGVKAPTR